MSKQLDKLKAIANEIATEIFEAVDKDAVFGRESIREIILYAVAKGYEEGTNNNASK